MLDVYYVLNGMIYQAPTIFSVLNARLRRCAHLLNQAQRTLGQAVGFEYHQQAGAHAYDHAMAAMGGGGSVDLYALKRGRGAGGGKRGSGRGGKRAKQQQAQHPPYPHHHGYPMMMPPPPHIASAGGYEAYYPPLRGEDMVMVDVGDGGQVPPPPLPSPGGSAGLVPPPPPGMEQELPPRLISRYPGPSPLTDVMTAAHPEGGAAVDKVVSVSKGGGGGNWSVGVLGWVGLGGLGWVCGVRGDGLTNPHPPKLPTLTRAWWRSSVRTGAARAAPAPPPRPPRGRRARRLRRPRRR